ncbi:MAG: hypothetical protein LKF96_07060 [Treponema sp.]|jgi:hypothetical protein|nr:hypothetical protein [Treponema sp.]
MALLHMEAPHTEQGKNLTLTDGQEQTCKVLYRKTNTERYEFAGFYNPALPDEAYPDGLIALPLRSTYRGPSTFELGTSVWNVEGSTGDYWDGKICSNWIAVWQTVCPGQAKICYVADSSNSNGKTECSGKIVGGHMIITKDQPQPGDDGKVFIIPICNSHNNYHNTVEMHLCAKVTAVALDRYHLRTEK